MSLSKGKILSWGSIDISRDCAIDSGSLSKLRCRAARPNLATGGRDEIRNMGGTSARLLNHFWVQQEVTKGSSGNHHKLCSFAIKFLDVPMITFCHYWVVLSPVLGAATGNRVC